MSEFVPLAGLCLAITKGTTPSASDGGFSDSGINYIKSESLSYDGSIDTNKFAFISDETNQRLKRSIIKDGDILYSIAGANLGKCGIARKEHLPANTNQAVAIIRIDESRASNRFISFFLRNSKFVQSVLGSVAQSAQPNVNLGEIGRFRIPNFPLSEQHAIASVLGALDDKIELNRRMNETLEATARAIFKDWFVDFGPTRAKMEGRAPYLPADIWSLFPDRLDDDGKPEGWRIIQLGQLLDVLETGGRPKGGVSSYFTGVPSVGAESITGLGKFDFSKTKFVPEEFFNSMNKGHVQSRDVLLYKDGGKPGLFEPHVTLFGDGFPFSKFAINEHVYRMRAVESYGQNCLYFWLSTESVEAEMRIKGTGVAIPGLNSTQVKSLSVVVPNGEIAKQLNLALEPFVTRILANCNESKTLAATRDFLLPKLMSGEVRVKDAEKLVGEAI